jgi:cytidine deaminase
MQKQFVQTSFMLFESIEELPEEDQKLLKMAMDARYKSYSPYSRFKVGAAALLTNGEYFGGTNYENAAYPLSICAEQALLAAASFRYPAVAVKSLAISVQNERQVINQPATPCGACRQVITESEIKNNQPMKLILYGETGPVWVFESGKDLLPFAFDHTFLK